VPVLQEVAVHSANVTVPLSWPQPRLAQVPDAVGGVIVAEICQLQSPLLLTGSTLNHETEAPLPLP
jgi:hypothetical protein